MYKNSQNNFVKQTSHGVKKNVFSHEWIFVSALTLLVMLLTLAPFIYGYFRQTESMVYSGYHLLSPGDTSVYYSYIQQVRQGHLLFKDLFTHESEKYNILFTYWIFPGWIGELFKLEPMWAFHISRILTIPLLMLALTLLTGYLYPERKKLFLIFLTFSTGTSGFFAAFLFSRAYELYGYYHVPMDLWASESNIFLTMLHSGHMIASLAFIVIIFYLLLKAFESGKLRYSMWGGILALILFSFHPFQVPVIFGVLGAYVAVFCVLRRKIYWNMIAHVVVVGILSSPMLVYYYWALLFDFVTLQRAIQNVTLTPAWHLLFFSYGFLLIFAVFGFYLFLRKKEYKDGKKLFIIVWMVVQFFLIFSPFNFQRRMSAGLQIPLVFLTIYTLTHFFYWIKHHISSRLYEYTLNNKLVLAFLFIVLFCSTNFLVLGLDVYLNHIYFELFYIPKDQYQALQWIKQNVKDQEVILSHQTSGYHIPGWTGKTVYIGHQGVETLYFHEKKYLSALFFVSDSDDPKHKDFLRKNNIRYVYFSSLEETQGGFRPEEKDYLRLMYHNGYVKIYRVVDT